MQPDVLERRERIGEHTRLLAQLDHNLEVPEHDTHRYAHWAHLPGALLEHESGRASDRDGCRRRNPALLERVPIVAQQNTQHAGVLILALPLKHGHPIRILNSQR